MATASTKRAHYLAVLVSVILSALLSNVLAAPEEMLCGCSGCSGSNVKQSV